MFAVGDEVKLKGKYVQHTSKLAAPQYLYGDILIVEKICKKSIKVSNQKYPGEYWYIHPECLEKTSRICIVKEEEYKAYTVSLYNGLMIRVAVDPDTGMAYIMQEENGSIFWDESGHRSNSAPVDEGDIVNFAKEWYAKDGHTTE